ncbi:Chemotaxis response regulator protein-glutamate methylesterase [bioreactor metagenome]|uniref:protein-glutamate methylesterase n=1 Tax=bioreactor metagenome TaxID=1076179 RepID=A0A644W1V7_9ZZZZ
MQTKNNIRLLIVDDSALFRAVLSRGVSADPDIEVVAAATDPFDARDKILEFEPDVMICDVVMPKMDGIEFIRRLMPQYPLRVVVVSSVSEAVLDAMNAGAVDFVAKPDISTGRTPAIFISELIEKIKIAAKANISCGNNAANIVRKTLSSPPAPRRKLIAIGASTGGTEAIFNVLRCLPPSTPGIVIVQHIPPVFSRMFADRLNNTIQLQVKEAQTGDFVETGHVLIAPGDRHMRVKKLGDRFRVELFEGEKTNGHCPSVDVLFDSVSAVCANTAVGVILTGMGEDGARGLLSMRKMGARTIGQDEKSCVVYGMPRAAFEMGAVEKQVPLESIAQAISLAITK